jgi:hypothetical protein
VARIRSIKPEFWTDGAIRRLSDTAALFFIGLWNHCDDAGYFTLDTLELSMKLPRWRSQEVSKLCSALHRAGLVKTSARLRVGLVVGWEHQRIDKPRPSKWEGVEIQWDDAAQVQEPSKIVRCKDRIGEDRIGEDRIIPAGAAPPAVVTEKVSSIPTWESYRHAYDQRYGTPPIRNASVNAKLSQFVKRVGEEEAPLVAEFYLTHNDAFYVKSMHPVGLLLRDAEKIRTEWATGRRMTSGEAKSAESGDFYREQMRRMAGGGT